MPTINQLCKKQRISKKKINKTINLDDFMMLTKGNTWYGRYGFIPYDTNKNDTHKEKYKQYMKNRKLVNSVLIKKYQHIRILKNSNKKSNEKKKEILHY